MGAKFAPSLANLFMGEWEDHFIYGAQRTELIMYRRYIDDLFFIWSGPESSLEMFSAELNSNRNNIRLEFNWSRCSIHYLDVEVMLNNNRLDTKVYFKPTDRNGYLPIQSGHHSRWLKNIPKRPTFES